MYSNLCLIHLYVDIFIVCLNKTKLKKTNCHVHEYDINQKHFEHNIYNSKPIFFVIFHQHASTYVVDLNHPRIRD